MARTDAYIDAAPETVFDVLSDPASYGEWVVGSRTIRDADPDWPAEGSRFHHTVGLAGPLTVSDDTYVEKGSALGCYSCELAPARWAPPESFSSSSRREVAPA